MARRPFSSGFPGLRFRSGPLARSCCATPPIPARLILLFRIVKTDDASSPRQRTVTMAMYRRPDEVPSPERSPVTQTKYRYPNEAVSSRQSTIILTKLVTQTKYRPPNKAVSPRRNAATLTKLVTLNLIQGLYNLRPLCYKSFASGSVLLSTPECSLL